MPQSLAAALAARIEQSQFEGVTELERAAGLGKGTVSKIFRGATKSPSVEVLEKIAAALGTTAASILGGAADGAMRLIGHDGIHVSVRLNPRKAIDPAALRELAASIDEMGLLEPLIVRPSRDGMFEVVAGERRWRAIEHLITLKKRPADTPVPVIVHEFDDQSAHLAALVENLQREDLNPLDEARAFAALRDNFDMPTDAIAKKIGKSQRLVQMRLQLLDAAPAVQKALANGRIGPACARALGRADPALQETLMNAIWAEKLSPSEDAVAAAIQRHATPPAPSEPPAPAFTGDVRTPPGEGPRHHRAPAPGAPMRTNGAPSTIKLDLPAVFQSAHRREGFPLELTLYDASNGAYGNYRLVP